MPTTVWATVAFEFEVDTPVEAAQMMAYMRGPVRIEVSRAQLDPDMMDMGQPIVNADTGEVVG